MVDSKFLIITTLCYVGIFVVVLVVCCCAWARYMRNEGKFSPRRAKHRTRRAEREPNTEHTAPQNPIPPPQRQEYRYIGDFSDLSYHHHDGLNSNLGPEFRPVHVGSIPRPPFLPSHPNYGLPPVPYPRNYYPASLATGAGTYDMDLQMELGSNNTYEDTSHGGFSGDDFSDFQSSRYDTDSRADLRVTSDGIGGLSCSMSDNVRSSSNNMIELSGLRRPSDCIRAPTNTINHDSEDDDDDDDNVSVQSSSNMLPDELLPLSRGTCDGAGNTPSCSVQTLSRNESEQSLTQVK